MGWGFRVDQIHFLIAIGQPRLSSWGIIIGVTNGAEHESSDSSCNEFVPCVLCREVMKGDGLSIGKWFWADRLLVEKWNWFSSWLGGSYWNLAWKIRRKEFLQRV